MIFRLPARRSTALTIGEARRRTPVFDRVRKHSVTCSGDDLRSTAATRVSAPRLWRSAILEALGRKPPLTRYMTNVMNV